MNPANRVSGLHPVNDFPGPDPLPHSTPADALRRASLFTSAEDGQATSWRTGLFGASGLPTDEPAPSGEPVPRTTEPSEAAADPFADGVADHTVAGRRRFLARLTATLGAVAAVGGSIALVRHAVQTPRPTSAVALGATVDGVTPSLFATVAPALDSLQAAVHARQDDRVTGINQALHTLLYAVADQPGISVGAVTQLRVLEVERARLVGDSHAERSTIELLAKDTDDYRSMLRAQSLLAYAKRTSDFGAQVQVRSDVASLSMTGTSATTPLTVTDEAAILRTIGTARGTMALLHLSPEAQDAYLETLELSAGALGRATYAPVALTAQAAHDQLVQDRQRLASNLRPLAGIGATRR